MTQKTSSSGPLQAGMLQKRYELKFIPGGRVDGLEWEDVTVTARLRKPGSAEPVPVKRVSKLADDSDRVLRIPDVSQILPGLEEIQFKVGVHSPVPDAVKFRLSAEPRQPVFHLDMEVEADPLTKTVMDSVLQMAAPAGLGTAAGAALGATTVAGTSEIVLEFPHPFIWHQLMDADFAYRGEPLIVDTDNDAGTYFDMHLREFMPSGADDYRPGQKIREVTIQQDPLDLLRTTHPETEGVTLAARRLLIAGPEVVENEANQPRMLPVWNPPAGSGKPPARNQADIEAHPPRIQYKAHTLQAEIAVFRTTANSQTECVHTEKAVHVDAEQLTLNLAALATDFKGHVDWKITSPLPRRFDAGFHREGRADIFANGGGMAAEITLPKTDAPLTQSTLALGFDMPVQVQEITIQISKMGWQTPAPVTLSRADAQCTDIFQALDQGGALSFCVGHDLKERFDGLDIPDAIAHPVVSLAGSTAAAGKVTCDDQGQVTCRFGVSSSGASLDISDRIPPLRMADAVLEPLRRLEKQARDTADALKGFDPGAAGVLADGVADIRGEYLTDYVVLPETSEAGGQTIASTAEARKYALLSLALMIDACGDTPGFYEDCDRNYVLAFRNGVSCFFTALVDGVLFMLSVFKSKELLKLAYQGKGLTDEAAGELTERGLAGQLDEGADSGARTAGEAAEDLSLMGPGALEKRLAANEARQEATEKAIKEIKEVHPNVTDEIDQLKKSVDELDNALKTAGELKEGAEKELDSVTRALDQHKQVAEAEKRVNQAMNKCNALKKQQQKLTGLVDEGKNQIRTLQNKAAEAQEALETLTKGQADIDVARNRKILEETSEMIRKAESDVVAREGQLQQVVKDLGLEDEVLIRVGKRHQQLAAEAAQLRPAAVLEKEKDALAEKISQCTSTLQTDEALRMEKEGLLQEANQTARDLASKESQLADIAAEKERLIETRTQLRETAKDQGIKSPAGSETFKSIFDNQQHSHVRRFLYGIPGVGAVLFVWDHWETILGCIVGIIQSLMDFIGRFLGAIEGDIAAFAERLQSTLAHNKVRVEVQPVYGPSQAWNADFVFREEATYLDPLNRSILITEGKKKIHAEEKSGREKLADQVKDNLRASLRAAFDAARAYKAPQSEQHFTLADYIRAEHQITGSEDALRQLLSREKVSRARSDSYYGWQYSDIAQMGCETWTDWLRVLDWIRWTVAWALRIFAILGAFGTIATGYGPVAFGLMFLSADGVDAVFNAFRAMIASFWDAEQKAMYLQLAVNYPCLARGWIFEKMKEYSARDLEAIDTWSGLNDFQPPDLKNFDIRLKKIKEQSEAQQ